MTSTTREINNVVADRYCRLSDGSRAVNRCIQRGDSFCLQLYTDASCTNAYTVYTQPMCYTVHNFLEFLYTWGDSEWYAWYWYAVCLKLQDSGQFFYRDIFQDLHVFNPGASSCVDSDKLLGVVMRGGDTFSLQSTGQRIPYQEPTYELFTSLNYEPFGTCVPQTGSSYNASLYGKMTSFVPGTGGRRMQEEVSETLPDPPYFFSRYNVTYPSPPPTPPLPLRPPPSTSLVAPSPPSSPLTSHGNDVFVLIAFFLFALLAPCTCMFARRR